MREVPTVARPTMGVIPVDATSYGSFALGRGDVIDFSTFAARPAEACDAVQTDPRAASEGTRPAVHGWLAVAEGI